MGNGSLEKSIVNIVEAHCLDFERRAKCIAEHIVTKRTEAEYRYLNAAVYTGAVNIVGRELAPSYIYDIGRKLGYAHSVIEGIGEVKYKNAKRLIKESVAKELHLIDK